uniref:Calcium-dependent protein kinase n=1 Tax=Ganoderma boninense TaxID=34458 RepID=A0A5K1JVX8_9APHY|nr:Calcium-dependent protein kinase [Ganoderma boninense]
MASFSSQVTAVILDATAATSSLDNLENGLFLIHELCVQETLTTVLSLDELLWELWTILGGNRSKLRDLHQRTGVLKEVQQYRAVAVVYVAAATQTILAVDAQLSDLRDRLIASALDTLDIPVDVHLASIERSLLRLQQDQFQPVPHLGSA